MNPGEGFPDGAGGPIRQLEREIQRRLDRKNLRKRPVTLFELIPRAQERREGAAAAAAVPAVPDGGLMADVEEVVGIAHEEGYQEAGDGGARPVRGDNSPLKG